MLIGNGINRNLRRVWQGVLDHMLGRDPLVIGFAQIKRMPVCIGHWRDKPVNPAIFVSHN